MTKVISLTKYRETKMLNEITQERKQRDYKVNPDDDGFAKRIARIRSSLSRINNLINDLKKTSNSED